MTAKDSYHHGDLRQTIIEKALVWIETENIANLSLRQIARQIGVSHNAPYRHFPDKENLLVAIAEIGFERLHQALQQALIDSPDNVPKRLEIIGVAHINYAINNQGYYRVMFNDRQKNYEKYPRLAQLSEQVFEVLLQIIQIGQEQKIFTAEDPLQLARVCWSLVHGVSMLAIDNQLIMSDSASILKLAQLATSTLAKGIIVH
jgi:AcrR family transcriptional regulator